MDVAVVVNTIAVIGAGALGRDITYVSVQSGYKTILEDVSELRLVQAVAWIAKRLEEAGAKDTSGPRSIDALVAHLFRAHTVEGAIRDADLIIETLPGEMEMQIELFTIFDKFAKPHAIFASTGFLPIAELAEVTFCPDRCLGMRFGQNAVETKTVELVKGAQTSRETIAASSEVAYRMGKSVVVIDEAGASAGVESERKVANAQS
jgi:3-hydroxybutyryl-CoA dehydrogenase